jgi:hypothetical protein
MFILTIGVIAWYETAYRDQDSLTQTVTSILQWFGTVVAGQVILIVMWEVGMVLASLYKQKRYEEGLQQGRQEAREEEAMKWRAWLEHVKKKPGSGERGWTERRKLNNRVCPSMNPPLMGSNLGLVIRRSDPSSRPIGGPLL